VTRIGTGPTSPERLRGNTGRDSFRCCTNDSPFVRSGTSVFSWIERATQKRQPAWMADKVLRATDLDGRRKAELTKFARLRIPMGPRVIRAPHEAEQCEGSRKVFTTHGPAHPTEARFPSTKSIKAPPFDWKKLPRARGKSMQDNARDTDDSPLSRIVWQSHMAIRDSVGASQGRTGLKIFLWG